MNKFYLAGALAACAIALLLAGCDKQKIADVIDSIKPDSLLLRNLQPGMTTVDDVRRQVGKPETARRGAAKTARCATSTRADRTGPRPTCSTSAPTAGCGRSRRC
ncbi:hypothetical protein Busp01_09420 [Trinickia caryophylli]|uniref:SmpA / OmlA family protein n=1 Tax=Trinickia caryophylli TaxID=28094 RepID=A0A1X7D0H0_TRICW|nr:hypothetical protein Busp01_09420 [Trinickia caryophylli]SMF06420.1 hypothetical protein SAMN06295900_102224 [Trinickia caryophylli]